MTANPTRKTTRRATRVRRDVRGYGLASLPDTTGLHPDTLVAWRVGPALASQPLDASVDDLLAAFQTDVLGPVRRSSHYRRVR